MSSKHFCFRKFIDSLNATTSRETYEYKFKIFYLKIQKKTDTMIITTKTIWTIFEICDRRRKTNKKIPAPTIITSKKFSSSICSRLVKNMYIWSSCSNTILIHLVLVEKISSDYYDPCSSVFCTSLKCNLFLSHCRFIMLVSCWNSWHFWQNFLPLGVIRYFWLLFSLYVPTNPVSISFWHFSTAASWDRFVFCTSTDMITPSCPSWLTHLECL